MTRTHADADPDADVDADPDAESDGESVADGSDGTSDGTVDRAGDPGSDGARSVGDRRGRTADSVAAAVEAFRAGDPVLVHDAADREGETDLLYPAGAVDPGAVVRLRREAGGLLFVALPDRVARAFDLPFLHEALDHPATEFDDVEYDARPSFSLSVNHRDTFTGITDEDRALTVRQVAAAAADPVETEFAAEFRSPGHVHLLRAAPGLLADREGHTELGVALSRAAGVGPAVAGAEMLDADTGGALSPSDARAFADRHGVVYVEGAALVEELA